MTDRVRTQIQERFSAFTATVENPNTSALDRSVAYGDMGKLLMAAGCFDAAEPFFLHAQAFAEVESRWPYYLGQIHKTKGDVAKSAEFFERAASLKSDDPTMLMRLADAYLGLGRPELAEPALAKALQIDPRSVAARFRLGRAALARQDHAGAVTHFEEGLKLDPRAAAIHYPLGVAYRELGDHTRADAHLRQRVDADVPVADPLMAELSDLLDSPAVHERRGIAALDRGDWAAAAASFRRGLELAPGDPSLHHRLGTALFLSGDPRAALEEFERALHVSPRFAKAHYSLGVLMETSGRPRDAIDRYSAAVSSDPSYIEARLRLAGVLARVGRVEDALTEYDRILQIDPRVADAQYSRASILMQLRRYDAAGDDLAQVASLLGELGRFEEAIAMQRQAIALVEKAGRSDRAARMTADLKKLELRSENSKVNF